MSVSEFFRWWRAELAGMLPDEFRRRFARRQDVLMLAPAGDEVRVGRRGNGRYEDLGRLDPGSADARGRMRALLGGLGPETTRVEVTVPAEQLLRKQIQLPLAAEENLREVLGFEMQRQTPFRAEQVYFKYQVSARRPQSQQITVALCVVPRSVVAPVLAPLADWDLVPADGGGGSGEDDGLFVFESGVAGQVSSNALQRTLLAVNIVLLAAVVAIPLLQQQRHLDELRTRLDEVRAAATTASDLQEQIDLRQLRARYLFDQKVARPASVELLEELSRRLPDDTWLFRVEVRDGKVHLQGTSTAASALISGLEDSRYLEDVRFASPVTQDGASGRERFHLSARVVAPSSPSLAAVAEDRDT